jgi:hypothetical protein
MSKTLPKLRDGLDFMPSPVGERPGLLIRDPFQYSDAILIVPPLLAQGLSFFNGEETELDLQAYLSKLTGQIIPGDVVSSMVNALTSNGFVEGPEFKERRNRRRDEFASSPIRLAAHAGTAYPDDGESLTGLLSDKIGQLNGQERTARIGIAAPHISPEGGWDCYAAAYSWLTDDVQGRTFVILGTSHYGTPERFGLTRKPFATPLGNVEVDTSMVTWLEGRAGDSIVTEDYCHSIEHSIEFQAVFLGLESFRAGRQFDRHPGLRFAFRFGFLPFLPLGFGHSLVFGLGLVVGQDLLDSLFVPAGRESVLCHRAYFFFRRRRL